ncbi:MAG TPA: single-stranded DNA-binding protein [Crinalium sp.]|jgi:single-stranded DNA-binding protein
MNSCILMAEIIQEPQLRYTSDNQTPIAEMVIQFEALREEDPPATLKVIGWGNLAQEIQENYHEGDRIIVEGRLNMNSVDRPEGFKEKRAELTAQRIHRVSSDATVKTTTAIPDAPVAATTPAKPRATVAPKATKAPARPSVSEVPAAKPTYAAPATDADYDDIPF